VFESDIAPGVVAGHPLGEAGSWPAARLLTAALRAALLPANSLNTAASSSSDGDLQSMHVG
jgi:hypothetical protein